MLLYLTDNFLRARTTVGSEAIHTDAVGKRPRGRPRTNDDDDDQLIEHWPMGTQPPLPNFAPPGTEAHRQYQSLLDNFEAYRRANEDS